MSVAIYSTSELNGLYRAFIEHGASAQDAEIALTTAGIANRLAYSRTYNEKMDHEPGDFTSIGDRYDPCPDWSLHQWARNLLYNTVSNGGTDFCPPLARQWLHDTSLSLGSKPRPTKPEPTPVVDEPDYDSVNDWTKAIKQALQARSKTKFSVTHGTGTAYGWISITVAKASKNPQADAAELRALMGAENDWRDSYSVAASRAYRREYLSRAKGQKPTEYGTPYWD